MALDENFKEFIKLLNANGVKYLVVGGYAVAFHGYPRYTKDLNFWIWADPENAGRTIGAIREFGFSTLGLEPGDFLDLDNVIQIGYEPNRIDLITQLESLDFEACFAARQEGNFEGVTIPFIGIDDLIKNKRQTGRPKDRLDAATLERKQKKKSGKK